MENNKSTDSGNQSSNRIDERKKHYSKGNRPNEVKQTKSSSTITLSPAIKNLMYERTLWILTNLIGKFVEVQVKSGEVYEGVFHTINCERGLSVILKMARKKNPNFNPEDVVTSRPMETFIVHSPDLVQIYAKDVSFDSLRNEKEFLTDAEISGYSGTRERPLQPWIPDKELEGKMTTIDFNQSSTSWDQFEINEKLFGVTSTYKEEIYTTPLDKNSEEYKLRINEAEAIAQQIEGLVETNPHVMEERGKDDSGILDEEERYGAVIRDTNVSKKYVPPAKRSGFLNKSSDSKQSPKVLSIKEERVPPQQSLFKKSDSQKKENNHNSPKLPKDLANFTLDSKPTPESKEKDNEKENADMKRNLIARTSSNEILNLKMPSPKQNYNERLRIARTVHADKLKPQVSPHKSPLQSPLIGNPNLINSLSLQPSSPSVSPAVVQSFVNSLQDKKKAEILHNRTQFTSSLKAFSKECVIPKAKHQEKDDEFLIQRAYMTSVEKSPSSKQGDTPSKEISKETPKETSKETTKETSKEATKETSKEIPKETSKETPKEIPKETSKEIPKEVSKETSNLNPSTSSTFSNPSQSNTTSNAPPISGSPPIFGNDVKKKLNPNAKEFKPMSTSAPVFTPKPIPIAPIPVDPMIYPYMQDPSFLPYPYPPYMYPAPSFYPPPFVGRPPMAPQQMFPTTVPLVPPGKRSSNKQPGMAPSEGNTYHPYVPSETPTSGKEDKSTTFQPRSSQSQFKSKFTPVPNTDSLPSTTESSKTS